MRVLGAVLFFAVASLFAQEVDIEKLKEENLLNEKMLKEIEKYKHELKGVREKAMERAKRWEFRREGNRVIVEERRRENDNRKESLPFVYVFMSSSVPEEVWKNYLLWVEKEGLKDRVAFLLRGCVEGCKYIKPTLEFLHKVLTLNGEREDGIEAHVWIDPLKFREYGVAVVPCVAVEGKKEISCGDWSLDYHLRRLGYGKN